MPTRLPPQPAVAKYRSRRCKSAFGCQSLAMPYGDLSFVDSDSDEEWSRTRKEPERKELRISKSGTEGGVPPIEGGNGNSPDAIKRLVEGTEMRMRALQTAATKGISVVLNTQLCDVAVKLLWLSVFHSAASKPAQFFEYSTFLGPSLVPVCNRLRRKRTESELPQQLVATAEFLKACRIPAGISIAFRLVMQLKRCRSGNERRGQEIVLSQIEGEGLRESMMSMTPSIEGLYSAALERRPATTREAAAIYRSVIHLFKCTLDWYPLNRCRKFSVRFDSSDLEITRYLLACNLLEARTEDDAERVFEIAKKRLQETLNWANTFKFVRDRDIKHRWSELVCWTKRLETGHPVLLMRLGAATRSCDGTKAEEYGRAVISQVDRGVRKLLRNDGIDTLVTIVDCQGATASSVNKFLTLLRSIPVTLNRHYPARLKALHLVNVPGFVIWLIQLVKRFLHPATREKIFVYNDDVSTFPPELHQILQAAAERREAMSVGSSSSQSESASAQGGCRGENVPVTEAPASAPSASSSANEVHGLEPRQQQPLMLEKTIVRSMILFLFFWIVVLILWSGASRVFLK